MEMTINMLMFMKMALHMWIFTITALFFLLKLQTVAIILLHQFDQCIIQLFALCLVGLKEFTMSAAADLLVPESQRGCCIYQESVYGHRMPR